MKCTWHPAYEASLRCANCSRLHCTACARPMQAGGREIQACAQPHCSGRLRPATVASSPVYPGAVDVYAEARAATGSNLAIDPQAIDETRLEVLLRRVFSRESLVTIAIIALPNWIASALTSLPANMFGRFAAMLMLIYQASVASYYFLLADHVGHGHKGVPNPSDGLDDWDAVRRVAGRGILCLLLGFAPVIVWSLMSMGEGGEPPDLLAEGMSRLGLLLLGLTYLPAAVLATVITGQTMAAVWPPLWFKIAARAPRPYGQLVVAYVLTVLAWSFIDVVGGFTIGQIPVVGKLVLVPLELAVLFTQAAFVGGFLRRHGDEFGYD